MIVVGAVSGCSRGPSSEQLDEWLAEARAADESAIAAHGDDDERQHWTLTVLGAEGSRTELRWPDLDRMADTIVDTDLPPEGDVARHARFRVVTLDEILDRVGGSEGHREVTLLAHDGFRATIDVADLEAHPIGLAVEADGHPIERASGGPLFTVFPISETPSLLDRYSSSWWVFYVTHVIVDTPAPRVRIVDRRPNRDPSPHVIEHGVIDTLPRNRVTMSVGYRTGWPSESVALEGVLVRELLEARDLLLEAGDTVRFLSVAPLTRGDARPTILTADDVMLRPTLLATHWASEGAADEPGAMLSIDARLGGPLTLATPAEVQARLGDRVWLTHVDEIVIEHPTEGAPAAAGTTDGESP